MKLLHTMIRVGNLEKSIQFYTEILGMKVLRQTEYPSGRFTNTFVGYGDEADNNLLVDETMNSMKTRKQS